MENINVYSVSKFTFIRYLIAISISFLSLSVQSEENPSPLEGRWEFSAGSAQQHPNNPNYYFETKESGFIDIRLENKHDSCLTDPLLYIVNESDDLLGMNDDWGSAPDNAMTSCRYNSRIIGNLPSGKYKLTAGTYSPNDSGDFVISVRDSKGRYIRIESEQKSKKMVEVSCTNKTWEGSNGRDHRGPNNPNFPIKIFEEQVITIDLVSSEDTYLYLINERKEIVMQDDDGGTDYNSRITGKIKQGNYSLVAATYSNNISSEFELKVMFPENSVDLRCDNKLPQENFDAGENREIVFGTDTNLDELLNSTVSQGEYGFFQEAKGGMGTGRITYRIQSANSQFGIVPETGLVTYTTVGSAIITVNKEGDNDYIEAVDSYSLDVKPAPQESFNIGSEKTITFTENGKFSRQANGGIGDGKVTYESTNPNFTVDQNGKVTFQNAGETTIKAKKLPPNANYLEGYAEYKLTVEKASQVGFDAGEDNIIYFSPDAADFTQLATGGNGDGKITYTSTTPDIADVSNSGKVTLKKPGKVTIKATKASSQNYLPAHDQYELQILAKINQPITFQNSGDSLSEGQKTYKNVIKTPNRHVKYRIKSHTLKVPPLIDSSSGQLEFEGTGEVKVCADSVDNKKYINVTSCYTLKVMSLDDAIFTAAGSKLNATQTKHTVTKFDFHKPFFIKDVIDGFEVLHNIYGSDPEYDLLHDGGKGISVDANTGKVEITNHGINIVSINFNSKESVKVKVIILDSKDLFTFKQVNEIDIADKEYKISWDAGAFENQEIELFYTVKNLELPKPGKDFESWDEKWRFYSFLYEDEIVGRIYGKKKGLEDSIKEIQAKDGEFLWNTSNIPEGEYYIVARINDTYIKEYATSEKPIIIEHNHGFAKDCSKFMNDPYHSVFVDEIYCNKDGYAYIHPEDQRIVTWSAYEGYEDVPYSIKEDNHGYSKIYPYFHGFVAYKYNQEDDESIIKLWGRIAKTYKVTGKIKEITYISFGANGLTAEMVDAPNKYFGHCLGPTHLANCKLNLVDRPMHSVDARKPFLGFQQFIREMGMNNGTTVSEKKYEEGNRKHTDNGGYTKRYSDPSHELRVYVKENGDAYVSGDRAQVTGFYKFGPEAKLFANERTSIVALKRHKEFQMLYKSDNWHSVQYTSIWADRKLDKEVFASPILVTKIYSNASAYAALRIDGSILSFGSKQCGGGDDYPKDKGYVAIYSNYCGFVAVKANGEMSSWGDYEYDNGFSDSIYEVLHSHLNSGGEYHNFNVSEHNIRQRTTAAMAPKKLNFGDGAINLEPMVLNPVPVELQSNSKIKVDWSSFNNTLNYIKNISNQGEIYLSENSFAQSEPNNFHLNDGSPDNINLNTGSKILSKSIAVDKPYFLTMVLKNESGDIVAYSRETKILAPSLLFIGEKTADKNYEIKWKSQSTNNGTMSLFYDLNNNPDDGEGVEIARNLPVDKETQDWSTANLPEGNYYIYAKFDENQSYKRHYSHKPVVIDHQHGISDCSSWYNFPSGKYNSDHVGCNYVLRLIEKNKLGLIGAKSLQNAEITITLEAENDISYKDVLQNDMHSMAIADEGVFWWDHWKKVKHTLTGKFDRIISSSFSFVGVKSDDKSIILWGYDQEAEHKENVGEFTQVPTDKGYQSIASNQGAFAALKDGKITTWGLNYYGGDRSTRIDQSEKFTQIFSTVGAFAALEDETGKITNWGMEHYGGSQGPEDGGYITIASSDTAFFAVKADGTSAYWGGSILPHEVVKPTEKIMNIEKIFSNNDAFAALDSQGKISIWGEVKAGGHWYFDATRGISFANKGYQSIAATSIGFSALKNDGTILTWGSCKDDLLTPAECYGTEPKGLVFTRIYSNHAAFAALDKDGYVRSWGDEECGANSAPPEQGYISIYSGHCYFVAFKADGNYKAWGNTTRTVWNKPNAD